MSILAYDQWLTNTPARDLPDEACDRCGNEIGNDFAIKVKMAGRCAGMWGYYCEDCAVQVERCDGCGFLRCTCPEES